MRVLALEGIVDHGLIRLPPDVKLPDRTKFCVIVPTGKTRKETRVVSPRLMRPHEASDFVMEVGEERNNAGL